MNAMLLCRRLNRGAGRSLRLSERGAVAGLEGLLFGMMILLGGVLLIVNAWSAIDAKTALDSASREYLRTYSEQPDIVSARLKGENAARAVLAGRETMLHGLELAVSEPNGFGPCSTVSVTVSAPIPTVRAPFLGAFGTTSVSSTASELVDAHREMTSDSRYFAHLTDCFDG